MQLKLTLATQHNFGITCVQISATQRKHKIQLQGPISCPTGRGPGILTSLASGYTMINETQGNSHP